MNLFKIGAELQVFSYEPSAVFLDRCF
jgi:hypothetical protein